MYVYNDGTDVGGEQIKHGSISGKISSHAKTWLKSGLTETEEMLLFWQTLKWGDPF
jgi:hypothetical protein